MPRPPSKVPVERDILSIRTLLDAGFTQPQMVQYYSQHGIVVSQQLISKRIAEMKKEG